jgi:hypothetical protein
MDFGKRLSLLMSVLNITNSAMAKALSVDPSLISRWRSGSRTPAKDSHYVEMIARYVADHAKMEHQKLAICEITGCGPETLKKENLVQIIAKWLLDAPMPDTQLIGGFLSKIGLFKILPSNAGGIDISLEGQNVNFEVFYGIKGKQRGVMKFLSFAMQSKGTGTLLLYSDESVDWFLSDRDYAFRLGGTLIELAKNGWKINMVHTISREISEMLAAIDFWLPLYMTGSVTPYYNPKYREHYFRRTLFVIPEIATFNCSTMENFQHSVSLLTTEKHIVELFEEEYNQFLNTCRPLMKIPKIGSQEMLDLLEGFEEQAAPSFLLTDGLPFITMPEEILESTLKQNKILSWQHIISHWRKRSAFFEKNLRDHACIHILTLPDPERAKFDKIPVELPEAGVEASYTLREYLKHLENLLYLVKKYENYHLCISQKSINTNVHVSIKDQTGIIIFKKDWPVRLFAINHPDMTNAFYCYAEDFLNRLPQQSKDRKYIIKTLEKIIQKLKE